jgi:hypothetical protein
LYAKREKVMRRTTRRWLLLSAGLVGLGITVLAVVAALALLRADDYPDALRVSSQQRYQLTPRLYLRRDAVYRTTDPFPAVYNYYSSRLDLGPESRAMSRCILLESARTWLFLHRYTGATICDTPNGRMMFVQRSVWVR